MARIGLSVQPQHITHVTPIGQQSCNPVIENVQTRKCLRPRKVAYPWTGETHFRVEPTVLSKSVFRACARILVPVNDTKPVAIADGGASHVIPPMNGLRDDKAVKQANLRLAAGEITAVESQREIFADHVTMPLCPLRRVIRKLRLTAVWTPNSLTFGCVNKAGTCPIKGDTPYFTAVQFWMPRRALQMQQKGQILKTFPPQFWKQ